MATPKHTDYRGRAWAPLGGEHGAIMVIVVMFTMIFVVLGLALYWLVVSQTRATETERTDVKSFNVAEAGVDAGMLALKLDWPSATGSSVAVDEALLKTALQTANPSLWNPTHLKDGQTVQELRAEFLQVEVYDNSAAGVTVTSPPIVSDRVGYDANDDGMMYVDASSNVDDDRHRILIMAERQKWEFTFPRGMSLFANKVASNGQGFGIEIENGPRPVYYDVHDAQGKGIEPGSGVSTLPSTTEFDAVFTEALRKAIEGLAKQQGNYFTDGALAQAYLESGQANGKVVYIKSDSAVEISGNNQIGTVAAPVVVVIDTPDGTTNTWDMKGSADLYGVLVTVGNSTLRGTTSIHGALYCSGTLDNKGNGSTAELNYNDEVIMNLNKQYVISVNIVPNSWEEYTVQ